MSVGKIIGCNARIPNVIPAEAGIQKFQARNRVLDGKGILDIGLGWYDVGI